MNTLSLLLLAALPQVDAPAAAPATVPASIAFEGTLAEGLAEIERLSDEGEVEGAVAVSEALLAPNGFTRWRRELEAEDSKVVAPALELADPLLERLGLNGYTEPLRAEVMYARGCARLAAEEREAAEREFADARAASGAGELRLVASYNRGTAALLEAETWRAQIPEVSGQPPAPQPGAAGLPPLPGMPGPPGMPGMPGAGPPAPGAEEEPDPLEVARGHYQRAKEALVERLRQDWRDADTRANVELVQRRLKELDEIEKQREEQQQEQDEQQEDQEQQDQEQQEQDDSQQQDSEDESEQDESDQEQEQEQEQPPESEGEEPEPEDEESDEQQESEEESEETQEPQEAEPQEIYLTREEVQRLLERLREHEEEAEALRARLYQQSRRRVERDW